MFLLQIIYDPKTKSDEILNKVKKFGEMSGWTSKRLVYNWI